jgi:hypothetical protein
MVFSDMNFHDILESKDDRRSFAQKLEDVSSITELNEKGQGLLLLFLTVRQTKIRNSRMAISWKFH